MTEMRVDVGGGRSGGVVEGQEMIVRGGRGRRRGVRDSTDTGRQTDGAPDPEEPGCGGRLRGEGRGSP